MTQELTRSDILSLDFVPLRVTPDVLLKWVEGDSDPHRDQLYLSIAGGYLEDDGTVTLIIESTLRASKQIVDGKIEPVWGLRA